MSTKSKDHWQDIDAIAESLLEKQTTPHPDSTGGER